MLVGLALAVGLLVYPLFAGSFRTFQVSLVLTYAIGALGLNLLAGYNGQLSIAQGSFFALGAYTSAIFAERFDTGMAVHLIVAAVLGLFVGYVVGLPALRLSGLYLALSTLALAVVTVPIIRHFRGLTGGDGGISGPVLDVPAWMPLESYQVLYFVTLAITLVCFALARELVRGALGRAMVATRDDEIAAQAMGIDVARIKTATFAIASSLGAVGGALFAYVLGFIAPETFTVLLSIQFLLAVIIGGSATLTGSVVGALYLVYVPNMTNEVNPALSGLLYGATIVLVMLVAPDGLVGGALRAKRAAIRKWASVGRDNRGDAEP